MATLIFLYRSNRPNAFLTVRLFFRKNNKNQFIEAKTNIFVSMEYWKNKHLQKHSSSTLFTPEKNNTSIAILKLEKRIFLSLSSINITSVSKQWLHNVLHKKEQQEYCFLIDYFDYYIECNSQLLRKNTIKRYQFVKNLLLKFENYSKQRITFLELDQNFKNKLHTYCLANNYAQSTINRNFIAMKTICNFADLNGIPLSKNYKNWKITTCQTDKLIKPIYLNFKELEGIQNLKIDNEPLARARDWLLISCYTGQRFSDFMRFDTKMIYQENDKYFMEFSQQKTNKNMVIAVHSVVICILQTRAMQFPATMSLSYYNRTIRTICKMAKITEPTYGAKKCKETHKNNCGFYKKWELISSHVGRRSFATNFYGKIPTGLLKSATGHSTERMLLVYIGKSATEQAIQLHNYF